MSDDGKRKRREKFKPIAANSQGWQNVRKQRQ